ncbi:MAG TPA: hypothetical protein VGU20_18245 [Stellaceae bacterium]|nr:hypothetical protein [Stellaceae bacterium]
MRQASPDDVTSNAAGDKGNNHFHVPHKHDHDAALFRSSCPVQLTEANEATEHVGESDNDNDSERNDEEESLKRGGCDG